MMRRMIPLGAAICVLLAGSGAEVQAQAVVPDSAVRAATAPTAVAGMPTWENSRVGVRVERPAAAQSAADEEAAIAARGATDPNVLLMIIGGAMLLAGMLIDDDAGTIIAVTGLALGVYGLIKYLD